MVLIKKDKYVLGQSTSKQIATMGEEIRLDLQLQPIIPTIGATVEGKVVDANGNPVANALIKIMDSNFEPLLHAITDANGDYLFNNIPSSSSYTIFAIASGMQLNQGQSFSLSEGQTKVVNFTLLSDPAMQLGIIAGDLYQSGTTTPINGAVVSLYSVVNGVETLSAITYTNQYGQFVFREVATGSYDIKISALGYLPDSISTSVTSASQIVSLQPTLLVDPNASNGTVSGVITNNLNAPIDRADVILYRVNADNTLTPVAFTKTNSSGVYLFINVPQGTYKVKSNELEIVEINIPGTLNDAPNLDKLTLAQASTVVPLSVNAATGTLANGAQVDATSGFAGYLGGPTDGSVTISINAPIAGNYTLAVKHINGDSARPMKLDVNGVSTGTTYSVPVTAGWTAADALVFNVVINLNQGNNTIKIHGDGTNFAPSVGNVSFTQSQYLNLTEAENATLSGSATISNGFVINLGGSGNGGVEITKVVPYTGVYDLILSYVSPSSTRTGKVLVNGTDTGTTYSFEQTASLNAADAKTKVIQLTLTAGSNSIKFM